MISDIRYLDILSKRLLDKDEHFFAPSLCNFLCAIKKNKELWRAINEKALSEENEDITPLNAKEAKLLKALKNDHEKVEQCCNEHKIAMPIGFMGLEGINEFRSYEQGKIASSLHIIDSLANAHTNALSSLANIDLEFVKQFAYVNAEGSIVALKISSLIYEWNFEKQALERKQINKFWYAWKQLTIFHDIFHDFEHLKIDALKRGELFKEWELCEDFKKINNLDNPKDNLYKKELRFYVQQLKDVLEFLPQKVVSSPAVDSLKQSHPNQKKYITVRINKDRIELFMCKKEELADQQEADLTFEMQANSGINRRHQLLVLLLDNVAGVSIKIIHEKLELKNSKQLDKAISGVNQAFRLKTNFSPDALIVRKKSKIIINGEYTVELIS